MTRCQHLSAICHPFYSRHGECRRQPFYIEAACPDCGQFWMGSLVKHKAPAWALRALSERWGDELLAATAFKKLLDARCDCGGRVALSDIVHTERVWKIHGNGDGFCSVHRQLDADPYILVCTTCNSELDVDERLTDAEFGALIELKDEMEA